MPPRSKIGQAFAAPQYFHPRPSAAGASGYDAKASGASNLGPTNPALEKAVADRAAAYRTENGLAAGTPVPVDAVRPGPSFLNQVSSVNVVAPSFVVPAAAPKVT